MFTIFPVAHRSCEADSLAVPQLQVLHCVWWNGTSG